MIHVCCWSLTSLKYPVFFFRVSEYNCRPVDRKRKGYVIDRDKPRHALDVKLFRKAQLTRKGLDIPSRIANGHNLSAEYEEQCNSGTT